MTDTVKQPGKIISEFLSPDEVEEIIELFHEGDLQGIMDIFDDYARGVIDEIPDCGECRDRLY